MGHIRLIPITAIRTLTLMRRRHCNNVPTASGIWVVLARITVRACSYLHLAKAHTGNIPDLERNIPLLDPPQVEGYSRHNILTPLEAMHKFVYLYGTFTRGVYLSTT